MITGIVIALAEELGTLIPKKLKQGETFRLNDNMIVIYSGAGAKNAQAAAETLVRNGAVRLISWGCAAGLTAELKPGTLILADQCISADGTKIDTHPVWRQSAESVLANLLPLKGAITASDQVVIASQEKKRLGLAMKAIALDMESSAIAQVAKSHHLPFLTVRAIADPQPADLPIAVINALNAQGQVDIKKLLLYLLVHPGELPLLIKLGWYFKAAKKTLKQVALKIDKIRDFAISTESTA
ncbi:MAG: phosphorylase [Gammaproteobacteria bacterium]|nr:phosphorylase [Gammaproteobacteria bacterium]